MTKEDSILFLTISLMAFLAGRIPYAGKFIRVFNTLFHEGGHALAAWICGGEVFRIELFGNTSGTTLSKSKNKFGSLIVSLAGYTFASFVAFLSIFLLSKELYWPLHLLIIGLSVLLLIKCVRNAFGIFWILLILTTYIFVLTNYPTHSWIMVYAFTGIMFYESLYSAGVIAFISFAKPYNAGDASNLANATGIPAQLWGILFLAQAIFFTWLSISLLLFKA